MDKSRRNLLKGIPALAIAPLVGALPVKLEPENEVECWLWDKDDDEQIRYIMESFDFHRTYRCMIATNWKWCSTLRSKEQTFDVPSFIEIKDHARHLLEEAKNQDGDYFMKSGGFVVKKNKGWISLAFEVSYCQG